MIIDDDFSFDDDDDDELPGYPLYPASDDVFSKGLIEADIDPEDISKIKEELGLESDDWNEKSYDNDLIGDDLDVPGSDLDDDDEIDGNEDEENNYYSLGGDNHNDLEENQGD